MYYNKQQQFDYFVIFDKAWKLYIKFDTQNNTLTENPDSYSRWEH